MLWLFLIINLALSNECVEGQECDIDQKQLAQEEPIILDSPANDIEQNQEEADHENQEIQGNFIIQDFYPPEAPQENCGKIYLYHYGEVKEYEGPFQKRGCICIMK